MPRSSLSRRPTLTCRQKAGVPAGWAATVDGAATAARRRAYAPYARFRVGVVLEGPDGSTHTGINVENLSFGLACCAERVGFQSAVAGE